MPVVSGVNAKSAGVEIDAGVFSVCGAHEVNEDFAGVITPEGAKLSPRGWLAVIADGVSASKRGRDAAHTAGEALFADFPAAPVGWDTTVALDRIISSHNEWLWRHSHAATEEGMETTLTALVVGSRFFTVAHVGDCRCYLLRAGRLTLLTQDHTRAVGVAQRGPLTRALGLDERVLIDYRQEPVQLDDVFILVSDGVWSVMDDHALQGLVEAAEDAQAAASALCQAAASRGSQDDASAAVLRVLDWAAHDLPLPVDATTDYALPPKLKPGERFDGLIIEQLVAEGTVTRVYRVRDESTGRTLALKTLARNRGPLKAEREALAREHWLSAHAPQCVPRALMPREAPSALYYLFEWIEGPTLEELANRTPPISAADWIRVARESLRSVGALHRRGVIHRDIKPQNLVREENGQVRVLDLGVAITRRRDDRAKNAPAGTPAFINPEQWSGAPPDERSDLFALGVTLFHVLTGAFPYGDIQPYQEARYEREPTRTTALRPDVPLWIDHWLSRAFSRRQNERYETAEEMVLALERAVDSGGLASPEPLPLSQRGTTGLLWIALIFSVLLNILLIVLQLVLPSR